MLVRDYQGRRHTVRVEPNGYVWEGQPYSSLSTIARAITSTAWSGPRFFSEVVAQGERLGVEAGAVLRYVNGSATLLERWQIDRRRLFRYAAEEVLRLAQQGSTKRGSTREPRTPSASLCRAL